MKVVVTPALVAQCGVQRGCLDMIVVICCCWMPSAPRLPYFSSPRPTPRCLPSPYVIAEGARGDDAGDERY